ncbi:splicing factor 3A subunit 2-like [Pollicipes pollicipes]|uniref:splicing factor 3A subunit 2-like n=1 Tax=Pollicipes pollicipes TaxID=41117 RepID=UPI0018850685|nr:splicing factor 3A subunit 2-like [Pollicipes pollicipes]
MEIADGVVPRHRFMSAYEQKIEPPDRKWQYLLFAAEPYETIAFKVPSREVEKSEEKFWTLWNKDTKQFFLQFAYKMEPKPPKDMVFEFPNLLPEEKQKELSDQMKEIELARDTYKKDQERFKDRPGVPTWFN